MDAKFLMLAFLLIHAVTFSQLYLTVKAAESVPVPSSESISNELKVLSRRTPRLTPPSPKINAPVQYKPLPPPMPPPPPPCLWQPPISPILLPSWESHAGLRHGGVAVAFSDARVIPWKANRWYMEEPILVVTDRSRKDLELDDSFYLAMVDGRLKVDRA